MSGRAEKLKKVSSQQAVGGAMYLGLSQVAKVLFTILSAIVIARILSPSDYGVVAMVSPVVAFIVMFQDLGLSTATIQRKSLSHEQSSALFWLNVYASLMVAFVLIAISPLVSIFYGDSRAGMATACTSIALILTGLGLQQTAQLNRNLNFSVISLAEILSSFVNFLTAAISALLFRSFWALVLGTIFGALAQLIVVWVKTDWRPSSDRSIGAAKELMGFGGNVTLTNFFNFFVRNADNILIAKFQGASALGLYDRSYKLMMMPLQNINVPLSKLLLPSLSRLQDDPVSYRKSFNFAISLLMLIIVPGIAVAAIYSNKLMPLLLGSRWAAAAPIFFWLGLSGIVQPVANMTGVLFISTGRTKAMVRWSLFSAIITIAGFIAGLPWGPEGVAAAFFITATARLPILFWLSAKDTAVRQSDLYFAQLVPLGGALAGVALSKIWSGSLQAATFFCLSVPVAYALSILSMALLPSGRGTLKQAGVLIRSSVAKLGSQKG